MLECAYCDYLYKRRNSKGKETAVCDFAEHEFKGDMENLDLEEYPCKNVTYYDYVQRKQAENEQ